MYLSPEGSTAVDVVRDRMAAALPADLLWRTPSDVLHSTLFEVAMLYRDYDNDKDAWFNENKERITSTLREILAPVKPVQVRFNEIEVSQSAVIIKGTDDGTFERIRKQVGYAGIIMPGSRTPPDIIHSSIFRYLHQYDLYAVEQAAKDLTIDFTMTVREFCLERISIVPIGGIERVYTFKLQ